MDYLHSAGGNDVAILLSHNMYLVDAIKPLCLFFMRYDHFNIAVIVFFK